IAYCLACGMLLLEGFRQPPGGLQLMLVAAGMFIAAGTSGPAGAMVANLTHPFIHGTAFATLTLANNLLGLAPGPILTGQAADAMGLLGAFRLLPIACLAAAAAFAGMRRSYHADLAANAHGEPA
ncbi:MAG: hypothetical protein RLZZ84_1724, partial [Pseudomonadota bacterium]